VFGVWGWRSSGCHEMLIPGMLDPLSMVIAFWCVHRVPALHHRTVSITGRLAARFSLQAGPRFDGSPKLPLPVTTDPPTPGCFRNSNPLGPGARPSLLSPASVEIAPHCPPILSHPLNTIGRLNRRPTLLRPRHYDMDAALGRRAATHCQS
jgi:hypothetical protein